MKRFIFVIVTNFIFAVGAFGQTPCPTISVMGPSGLTEIGGYMTFVAKVEGENLEKISYKWSVAKSDIYDGQGTPVLRVVANDWADITVTVEIEGLSPDCPKTASASASITGGCGLSVAIKFDEISFKGFGIDKARLQNLAFSLRNEPPAKAYLVERFKLKTSPTDIKRKLATTFSFLTKILGISAERITWQISYGDENLTEFWLVPARAEAPEIRENGAEIKGEDFQNQIDKLFPITKKKSSKPTRKSN